MSRPIFGLENQRQRLPMDMILNEPHSQVTDVGSSRSCQQQSVSRIKKND